MAINLAEKFGGEIICADSRTVYKGMDNGTAKPTRSDQKRIKHHLLDIVNPDEEFNAADMKKLAAEAIKEIAERGKIPFLVGGTGLYINGVIYDFRFGNKKDPIIRKKLEKMTGERLQKRAIELGIRENEINFKNRRHLLRAVERGGIIKSGKRLRKNCLLIGVDIEQNELKARIKKRVDRMLDTGLEEEVRILATRYGFDAPGMSAICYKEWQDYFAGEQSLKELKENLCKNTWQYARRQRTWFKRDGNIRWIISVDEASRVVQQFLIQ
jgi:tRNA dimethylallyltransferase